MFPEIATVSLIAMHQLQQQPLLEQQQLQGTLLTALSNVVTAPASSRQDHSRRAQLSGDQRACGLRCTRVVASALGDPSVLQALLQDLQQETLFRPQLGAALLDLIYQRYECPDDTGGGGGGGYWLDCSLLEPQALMPPVGRTSGSADPCCAAGDGVAASDGAATAAADMAIIHTLHCANPGTDLEAFFALRTVVATSPADTLTRAAALLSRAAEPTVTWAMDLSLQWLSEVAIDTDSFTANGCKLLCAVLHSGAAPAAKGAAALVEHIAAEACTESEC